MTEDIKKISLGFRKGLSQISGHLHRVDHGGGDVGLEAGEAVPDILPKCAIGKLEERFWEERERRSKQRWKRYSWFHLMFNPEYGGTRNEICTYAKMSKKVLYCRGRTGQVKRTEKTTARWSAKGWERMYAGQLHFHLAWEMDERKW